MSQPNDRLHFDETPADGEVVRIVGDEMRSATLQEPRALEVISPVSEPVRPNGMGLAGFLLSLAGLLVLMSPIPLVVLFMMCAITFHGEQLLDVTPLSLGLETLGGVFLSLAGLGLSIGALCRRGRRKNLAVAGLVLGGIALLIMPQCLVV